MDSRASSLTLIKSSSRASMMEAPEPLSPGCDLCSSPIEAHVIVETDPQRFERMALCTRHLDHLRQYLGAERFQAALEDESKTA